jgi:beta-lactamase class A
MESKITRKVLLYLNLVFCLVIILLIAYPKLDRGAQVEVMRDYSGEYKFTNPILDYENVSMERAPLLYQTVGSKIKNLEDKYHIAFSSVYYRDLNNGQWIGINEKEPFAIASLIKIPILFSILKEAQKSPEIMDKTVQISDVDKTSSPEQNIKPEEELVVGSSYTIKDLSERMITQSDNVAATALLRNIDGQYRKSIFESVGVKFEENNDEVMVSVKDYAGFFRVLFNSSYLDRQSSEYALDLLSKTTFDKGIVAGVPSGVVVSHKFGERSNYVNGILANKQLHDCGIIYYPGKPYLLCVMTRGQSYEDEEAFIQAVSQFFYQQVARSSSN